MVHLISTNPANGTFLGEVEVSSALDVARVVEASRSAQAAWFAMGAKGRVKEMRKLYAYLHTNRALFEKMETQEMGKPISSTRSTMDWGFDQFAWNLDHAEELLAPTLTHEDDKSAHYRFYEPHGVAAVIAPWNFPFNNWVMGAVQPLLAGNSVIYKASEEVPLYADLLGQAWIDAGLPPSVFQIVQGDGTVGDMLARADIDFLDFTGSTFVGQKLYKIAAEKFIPIRLELGGSDAGIIFDDVDCDTIIPDVFWAKFINCGQICCGLKRLFVARSLFDLFTEKFTAFVEKQKIGDPMEKDTIFGSLAATRQQTLCAAQIEDARAKGATLLTGGKIPEQLDGAYYEPTLLTGVDERMRAYHEELFAPVLPIWPFDSEEEAIRLANNTPYGLSAYVFTADPDRFNRVAAQLEAGNISHNGIDHSHPASAFGGYKNSGLGRTGGAVGLHHTCKIKTVSCCK